MFIKSNLLSTVMDTPQLNPSELYDKRRTKDAGRLRAYNKILEQIHNRIRTISKLPNLQCFILYTVPPFILGLPKLDLEDCVIYLIYQLRHSGYEVRYTPPNLIYISWLHHEKSYLTDQSPIMKAMLESSERSELERKEKEASRLIGRKGQRKIVKQTPGAFQGTYPGKVQTYNKSIPTSNSTSYPSTSYPSTSYPSTNYPSAGHIPSAGDYVPPASFIQNMSNPQNQIVYPKSVPEYFKR